MSHDAAIHGRILSCPVLFWQCSAADTDVDRLLEKILLLETVQADKASFSFENFWLSTTIALLFVFDKNYLIMDYLGLKDSSHDFSANCIISFFFVYI